VDSVVFLEIEIDADMQKKEIDLIVMGSRGMGDASNYFGSVAREII